MSLVDKRMHPNCNWADMQALKFPNASAST